MCKSSFDPGGPKRCSSDARNSLQASAANLTDLAARRDELTDVHDDAPQGPGSALDVNRTYSADIKVSTVYAANRFARTVMTPGRSVLLDTETTSLSGPICEIAIIDTHSGDVLLNTLVNPRTPINPAAQAIHGISDTDVSAAGVPDFGEVYPLIEQATEGRLILAYNADFDRSILGGECERNNIADSHVTTHRLRWADVMVPRTHYARSPRWLRNEGGHRALGDVLQTREHLLDMATGNALTEQDSPHQAHTA